VVSICLLSWKMYLRRCMYWSLSNKIHFLD